MDTFIFVVLIIAMIAVLGVLATGVVAMGVGGKFNKDNSNRLMRWRVVLQAIALALFAILLLISKG